ncbi:uncharacterized protein LOC134778944 [Penaeus indicus]|uniref:uncharacterized protein LOC134778944 n=1 Tax=Penaeus indicus TaxID=29960 RepID=UPI00300D50E7
MTGTWDLSRFSFTFSSSSEGRLCLATRPPQAPPSPPVPDGPRPEVEHECEGGRVGDSLIRQREEVPELAPLEQELLVPGGHAGHLEQPHLQISHLQPRVNEQHRDSSRRLVPDSLPPPPSAAAAKAPTARAKDSPSQSEAPEVDLAEGNGDGGT